MKNGIQYLELFIDDTECYFEKNIGQCNKSNRLLEIIAKSEFKRVYIISGQFMSVIGLNPAENVKRFNN